jgi:hypothetical protein
MSVDPDHFFDSARPNAKPKGFFSRLFGKRTPHKRAWLSQSTRSRFKRCTATMKKNTYSLPIDIMNRDLKPLANGDFEVLPLGQKADTFDEVVDQILPNRPVSTYTPKRRKSYELNSNIENNWMSRCVRNRFVLPRNFVSNDFNVRDRTVPFHRTNGKVIVFHTEPPAGESRVLLSEFRHKYGPHGAHASQTFGGRRTRRV